MRIRVSRGVWVLLAGGVVFEAVATLRAGETAGNLWRDLRPWLTVAAAVVLHELGHIIAAWGSGVKIRGLRLDLFGARMELEGLLSYGQEFFVAAGGPLINLICVVGLFPLVKNYGGEAITLFWGASAVLGGVNLLPVGTLDGGRMLRSGAAWLWGDRVAVGLLRGTTLFFLGILWLLAVYGLIRAGQMLSLFVFSLCLLLRSIGSSRDILP